MSEIDDAFKLLDNELENIRSETAMGDALTELSSALEVEEVALAQEQKSLTAAEVAKHASAIAANKCGTTALPSQGPMSKKLIDSIVAHKFNPEMSGKEQFLAQQAKRKTARASKKKQRAEDYNDKLENNSKNNIAKKRNQRRSRPY